MKFACVMLDASIARDQTGHISVIPLEATTEEDAIEEVIEHYEHPMAHWIVLPAETTKREILRLGKEVTA
jgi:hypothetical protein